MMNLIDTNGDGRISLEEFLTVLGADVSEEKVSRSPLHPAHIQCRMSSGHTTEFLSFGPAGTIPITISAVILIRCRRTLAKVGGEGEGGDGQWVTGARLCGTLHALFFSHLDSKHPRPGGDRCNGLHEAAQRRGSGACMQILLHLGSALDSSSWCSILTVSSSGRRFDKSWHNWRKKKLSATKPSRSRSRPM